MRVGAISGGLTPYGQAFGASVHLGTRSQVLGTAPTESAPTSMSEQQGKAAEVQRVGDAVRILGDKGREEPGARDRLELGVEEAERAEGEAAEGVDGEEHGGQEHVDVMG